ncbi:hypothetical protein Dda_5290 [Drechslerella dactyloides]|uniref:Uncharacterized protein n=1 Tax=Drechslerella dactyloides TaxID=74499 RepID=A0AAD6IWH7_DREDA|nr:hypothetical protein Dda_5290 [Drechslerella dactyloides]
MCFVVIYVYLTCGGTQNGHFKDAPMKSCTDPKCEPVIEAVEGLCPQCIETGLFTNFHSGSTGQKDDKKPEGNEINEKHTATTQPTKISECDGSLEKAGPELPVKVVHPQTSLSNRPAYTEATDKRAKSDKGKGIGPCIRRELKKMVTAGWTGYAYKGYALASMPIPDDLYPPARHASAPLPKPDGKEAGGTAGNPVKMPLLAGTSSVGRPDGQMAAPTPSMAAPAIPVRSSESTKEVRRCLAAAIARMDEKIKNSEKTA